MDFHAVAQGKDMFGHLTMAKKKIILFNTIIIETKLYVSVQNKYFNILFH